MSRLVESKKKNHSLSLEFIQRNVKKDKKRKYSLDELDIESEWDSIADDEITSILMKREPAVDYIYVGEISRHVVFPYEESKEQKRALMAHNKKFFSK